MKCLITGGAGFIGSHIQDKLIELGHEVGIIDSMRSGKKANLNPKSEFFEIDVRDQKQVPEIFAKFKPDAVFHLAAQNEVPYSMAHPDEDTDINILGMINILNASKASGVKKFIYSNTGGAYYGDVPGSDLPISEDHPVPLPTSFYGVSKAAAEQYLKLYGHVYGLPWVALRYSNVFGPRQDGNREAGIVAMFVTKMISKQIPTINGDGLHTRDYVYVGDVVAANIAALTYSKNDYFNISTATRVSNNQVFATIEKYLHTGFKPIYGPDRPGDARHVSLNNAKAAKLLSWSPKISFDEGVRLTLKFYE
jgi:UDP-glucose 4-epimerase